MDKRQLLTVDEKVTSILQCEVDEEYKGIGVRFWGIGAEQIEALIDAGLDYLFLLPKEKQIGVMEIYHFLMLHEEFVVDGRYRKEGCAEHGINIYGLYANLSETSQETRQDFMRIAGTADNIIIQGNYYAMPFR